MTIGLVSNVYVKKIYKEKIGKFFFIFHIHWKIL